jgi:copper chaperone CopZ
MVTVRAVNLVPPYNLVWLPTAAPLESYASTYKSVSVPKSTCRYCVDAVTVNLNHCEPFDARVPFAHVSAVSGVTPGGYHVELNAILYVPELYGVTLI